MWQIWHICFGHLAESYINRIANRSDKVNCVCKCIQVIAFNFNRGVHFLILFPHILILVMFQKQAYEYILMIFSAETDTYEE